MEFFFCPEKMCYFFVVWLRTSHDWNLWFHIIPFSVLSPLNICVTPTDTHWTVSTTFLNCCLFLANALYDMWMGGAVEGATLALLFAWWGEQDFAVTGITPKLKFRFIVLQKTNEEGRISLVNIVCFKK